MLSGIHILIYSKDAEADKAFFRDVLKLPNVDAGQGRLIFRLPPSELGLHASDDSEHHEMYLMCDDVGKFVKEMTAQHIACTEVQDLGWGQLTQLTLPGGGKLGVYQPMHARPK